MKILSSRYALITLPANQSSHNLVLPVGMVRCSTSQRLRVYLKKIVVRNDSAVVSSATNTLVVNGSNVSLRTGSPNAVLLADELTKKVANSTWLFDAYDGRLSVQNTGGTALALAPGTCGAILGLSGSLTVPAGQVVYLQNPVNLSPPDALYFRSDLVLESLELAPGSPSKSSDILCCVGMDVPPYGTKVYRDENGMFGHFLVRHELNVINFRITDPYGNPVASASPMSLVLCAEIWTDDEAQLVRGQRDQTDLLRLSLLQSDIQK